MLFFSLSLSLIRICADPYVETTLKVCQLISALSSLSHRVSGHRFWLCQTRKGPDLDTVWHPGIFGSRDYSQQGEPVVTFSHQVSLCSASSGMDHHILETCTVDSYNNIFFLYFVNVMGDTSLYW